MEDTSAETIEAREALLVETGLGPASRVMAVFLCGTFAFLDLYCTQPLLPLLTRVFHASETRVGLTISASTFGVAISAALLAVFGERFDRKRLIVAGMATLAIAAALTATAPGLNALACWRLLQGLFMPAIFIITIAYVTEEWPALLVPRVMSVYVAGTVFGGFVGRVAGGTLANHLGWRVMFLILGLVGVAGALTTRKLLSPSTMRREAARNRSLWAPVLQSLKNKRLLATFAIGFCMLFALVAIFSYVTFHLAAAPYHLSTTALSWLFSVYLVGLAATLAVGTLLARVGLRHGMLAAVGLGVAGVLLTLTPSLFVIAIGLSLASSAVFVAQTCANSFLRDAAPAGSRVSAAGLYICSYYVGGTTGGILPGLLWRVGGWSGCVALVCGLLGASGLLAFFGWRSKDSVPEPIPL